MTQILTALPQNARVAIIRLRSLGDCVLTTPAIRILKTARPDLRIAVVVEPRFENIFEGAIDIERLLPPTVSAIVQWNPDLVLNLHGGTRSMVLTASSRARWRAGFQHHRGSLLYNVPIPRAQQILGLTRTVHTAEHLASAMFYLGAPQSPVPRAHLASDRPPVGTPYAIIHAVAATPEKTWPASKFVEAATALLQSGLDPVFMGAPTDDLSPFRAFDIKTGTLKEAKRLLAGASLFLGNDSGPAHIAAAFGVPSVVLFGPSDPVVWAPWQVEHRLLQAEPISSIEVNEVASAIQQLTVKV